MNSFRCILFMLLLGVLILTSNSLLWAEQEVFWRETASEKIKIIVEDEKVVSRWVFPKKTAHGERGNAERLLEGKPFCNSQQMKLNWIPAGSFSTPLTSDAVDVGKGFWISVEEVSQGVYERVMGENPSNFRRYHRPVERVGWKDAQRFCKRLTARERASGLLPLGFRYRLPREMEWEYACRAGSTGDRYGDVEKISWYRDNSGGNTHDVGLKKPNSWGLFDTLGNVSEWCSDKWISRSRKTRGPEKEQSPNLRVYRGGSYLAPKEDCKAFSRGGTGTQFIHARPDIGFRCVLSSKQ